VTESKKTGSPTAGDGSTPVDCTTTTCPLQDDVVLVELVEVYADSGTDKTQAPTGRDQYINLDEKVENAHPEYGRFIRLKARLEWKSGDKTRSLAGKNVFWYRKADGGNKAGLTGTEKEGFSSAGGAEKAATSTDAKGWTAPVKFFLSLYGGDKVDVFATEDPTYKGGLKAGTYTVWRKFWYHVTEMKEQVSGKFELPAAVTSAFEAGYSSVFMKFIEKGPRTEATHVGNLRTAADRANEAKKYFVADTTSPFKCHIMTVDYSQQGTTLVPVADNATTASWTTPTFHLLWRHDTGALPWKVSAKYKPDGGSWTDIPDAKLSVTANPTQRGYKTVTVDLSGVSPAPSAATPAAIKLELKVASFEALGWGGGSHHLYLCTGFLRDVYVSGDWNPMQSSDAVHEIGHAFGLVNMPPAPSGAHNAWEDSIHANHCRKPPSDCAMWYQSATTRLTTFHNDAGTGCHDYMRRQDFARAVMENRWKD
jgi:hypothetical protein